MFKIGDHIVPFRGLATQRQLLSMSCTEPLVIMSIRPSKVSPHDLPARMVFDHLHPYLQGNIAYVDIDFNFSTTAFADSYEERLVSELRIGSLKRFQRFAIFLADKSPSGYRGTQVILIEDSKSLKELFQKVFLDEFCALLSPTMASTSKNMLTLLTRTDILSNAERFTFLKDLASRQYFAQIAAFTQPNLPACSTHEFILALHLGFHVYMRPGLDGTINEQDNLGQYNDIVVFQKHGAARYVWTHITRKPFGQALPAQCSGCGSIYPYNAPKTSAKGALVVLTCSHCKATQEFRKGEDLVDIAYGQCGARGGMWYRINM